MKRRQIEIDREIKKLEALYMSDETRWEALVAASTIRWGQGADVGDSPSQMICTMITGQDEQVKRKRKADSTVAKEIRELERLRKRYESKGYMTSLERAYIAKRALDWSQGGESTPPSEVCRLYEGKGI